MLARISILSQRNYSVEDIELASDHLNLKAISRSIIVACLGQKEAIVSLCVHNSRFLAPKHFGLGGGVPSLNSWPSPHIGSCHERN